MENSSDIRDKMKSVQDLERYSIMVDYFEDNEDRVKVNKYNQGIELFHSLLDINKSAEAARLRDRVYRMFFPEYAKRESDKKLKQGSGTGTGVAP